MAVVVDANLLVVLASKDPRASAVERHVRPWVEAGVEIHAPDLLLYEVASALTQLVAAGQLGEADLSDAWSVVDEIPLHLHSLTGGPKVVAVALRLNRRSAYDAAYLVLAEQLGADLWTLDGPLARNASGLGFPIHLIA